MSAPPGTTAPLASARSQSGPRPACPLCGGAELRVADAYRADDLRKAWQLFGVKLPAHAWCAFDGVRDVELYHCCGCGFEFCDPRFAGDGAFYAELERQRKTYYPPDVPEFHRTLRWARQRGWRTLLDVGCGEGAFLDLARAAGLEVTGLELNLSAAEVCRGKGHTIHTCPLSDLVADKRQPRFDLVTVFQVLEHVPAPVQFLSEAARLARAEGGVSVAVPNESGIYRICPKEPHQWPPHHVTRWRLRDLRAIGERCGLSVAHAGTNRLGGFEIAHFWKLRNELASLLGERPLPGGAALPRAVSLVYRKLGLRHIVPGYGTSVYALYSPGREAAS